ncbi:MAG: hypothetical protein ABMB14_30285, partial [Myxococcota bacterium]
MSMTELEASLRGEPLPVYIVLGEAAPIVERARAAIQAAITPRLGPIAFNHGRYRAADPGATQAFVAARTLPMMADRRLVEPRRVERKERLRPRAPRQVEDPAQHVGVRLDVRLGLHEPELALRERRLRGDEVRRRQNARVDLALGERELLLRELTRRLLDLVALEREDDVPVRELGVPHRRDALREHVLPGLLRAELRAENVGIRDVEVEREALQERLGQRKRRARAVRDGRDRGAERARRAEVA